MGEIYDEYQNMLDQGIYEDEDELMREEGLDYADLYRDEYDEDDYDELEDY